MIMKKQLLIAALATIALLILYNSEQHKGDAFNEWKAKFGVSWNPKEEIYRRFIFEKNLIEIERHNSDSSQTYRKGINQFTIYTQQEFIHLFLNPRSQEQPKVNSLARREKVFLGDDIDWQARGMVSPVKNQGLCGSCYAFSATSLMQTWGLINGKEVDLSEQQIIDCTLLKGNFGCRGGWPQYALDYVKLNGITYEVDYPYAGKNQNCSKEGGPFQIQAYNRQRDCPGLYQAILVSPVTVDVDGANWGPYSSGVFTNCGIYISHNSLLVGIIDGNYKIKNSWGTVWGEEGYITVGGPGNTCGICSSSIYVRS